MRRLFGPPGVLPALAWLALVALAFGASSRFEVFERLHDFSRAHEDWQIDELFSLLAILSLSLPLLLLRWNRRLAGAFRRTQRAETEVRRIAFHDPLTGLANRRHLLAHLEAAIARAAKAGSGLGLLLLDLDRFKPINDLRGHEAGDRLLREAAARLRALCPAPALVARLGGDEFVIALPGPVGGDRGAALARRILDEIERPFDLDGRPVTVTGSVGIAGWSPGTPAAGLLRHADQAMYRAKQAGRGGFAHYDEALGERLRAEAELEQDLRAALAAGEVAPHFQPIFDIAGSRLRGLEVLARWHHPVRGPVPPDRFIPLAEEIGLIDALSDALLDRACAALAAWGAALPISFNLSPRQFADPGLADRILATLARHGLPGPLLEIEITERAVAADPAMARRTVAALAAAGVRIALDDFGTGISSLATLTSLPIARIKIDRSFVAEVDLRPEKARLVSGVLALAESLGLEVTAEGIERAEELAFLRSRRCALGQGFLLGRPQPAEEVERLLASGA